MSKFEARRMMYRRRRFAFGEPIDDGRHYYHSKKLCFDCRKVWRPNYYQHWQSRGTPIEMLQVCPQCRQPLVTVGPMFKTPRQRDVRSWRQLAAILRVSIDSKSY